MIELLTRIKQTLLKSLSILLVFSSQVVITLPSLSQTPAEQRKQFFLEALLNPENIEAQIRGYAQYKENKKYHTLYSIYQNSKEDLDHKEKMKKLLEEQLAQYEEPMKSAMKASLEKVYVKPPLPPMQDHMGFFVQSYLMSLRTDLEDELNPQQTKKIDLLLSRLDQVLLLSYQSRTLEPYDYKKVRKEPAEEKYFEVVYTYFLRGIMNITDNSDYSTSNDNVSDLNMVRIIRYGELIDNEHLPVYGQYDGYIALIKKKKTGQVRYVPLSKAVLSNIRYYKQYIDQYGDPYSSASIENDSSYYRYWYPIQKHLGDVKEIYLEPAGIYHGVALQALRLPDGKYLSDKLSIIRIHDREDYQVANNNRQNYQKLKRLPFEIYGYPDYDYDIRSHQPVVDRKAPQKPISPLKEGEQLLYEWVLEGSRDYPAIPYEIPEQDEAEIQSLAMSKIESRVLYKLLAQHQMKGRLFLNSQSNQFNLTQIESPGVLHLTTHTSFGGESPLPLVQDSVNGGFENNTTRIFLAGGRESLNTREFYNQFYSDIGKVIDQQQKDIMAEYYRQVDTTGSNAYSVSKVIKGQMLLKRLLDSAGKAGLSKELQAQLDATTERGESFSQYDGVIDENEIIKLKLYNTEVVSLSSCGPQGADRSPRALLTLADSFLKAGAKSVLGSMWPVNDEASALFMLRFYHYWVKGESKFEAMKLAKSDIKEIPGFEHPHFWAGWMLYGKQR